MNTVQFIKCYQSSYESTMKDENTLYFVQDTGKIYLGTKLVGQAGSGYGMYSQMFKLENYTYVTTYDTIDYAFASDYYRNNEYPDPIVGGCSCFRKGQYFARQLDWTYNHQSQFVVITPAGGGRYSSFGIAGSLSKLTQNFVDSGVDSTQYKIIPFRIQDGMNEHGVAIETNVVPRDKGQNMGQPRLQKEITMCSMMVPRYVLDHFKTAKSAAEYLRDHAEIYFAKDFEVAGYEQHWVICDRSETYLITIVENETKVINMTQGSNSPLAGKPYATNFYLEDVILNSDGSVYTPKTQDDEHNAIITNQITEHGAGLERYNLIASRYADINSKSDVRELLNQLMYTRTYITSDDPADPVWYTEYTGIEGLTVASNVSEFQPVAEYIGQVFLDRTRDPDQGEKSQTWQTVHSVIYDLENGTMNVVFQESGIEHEFTLQMNSANIEWSEI